DPKNALAWVGLARAYGWQAGYGVIEPTEGARRAREATVKALALAPQMAEAHLMLGSIQAFYDRDWKAGEKSLERALALAPENAAVLQGMGQFCGYRRRFEEAEKYGLRALEHDPLSSRLYSQLGNLYRVTRRLDEAERAFRKALELSPERITAHHLLGLVLAEKGDLDAALEEVKREPAEWGRLTGLTDMYWKMGRRAEADAALAELEAKHATDSAFQIAAVYAIRGDIEAAFSWIDRGIEQHDAGMNQIAAEPIFEPLYGDPRWLAALRRIGLAD